VADDQAINLEQIKICLEKLCPQEIFEYFYEGQSVIDRVKTIVEAAIWEASNFPLQPLRALIVDFNMPIKDGIEVINEVK
jgi:CheY-like chemotaxis protein